VELGEGRWDIVPQVANLPTRAACFRIWGVLKKLCCVLVICGTAGAQTAVEQLWEQKLNQKIRAVDQTLNGVMGVAAIDLNSGRVFAHNGDAQFPTASSIKIPILIQMFRDARDGKFAWTDQVTLGVKDNVGGSEGPLQEKLNRGAVTLTIRELVEHMIIYSDNSATNRCIDIVGMARVNALLAEFGMRSTHLRRKMMDVAAAARGDENVSTPLELARVVERLYRGTAADPESCREMLGIMKKVNQWMRPVIPPGIEVASKPGDLDGVRCEVGLVYLPKRPFIVNVMSTWLDENANPVGKVTGMVFEYFSKLAGANQYGRKLQ
jgi:beta-lactamase class A